MKIYFIIILNLINLRLFIKQTDIRDNYLIYHLNYKNEEEFIGWLIIILNFPVTGRWSLPVTGISLYFKHSQLWSGWSLPQYNILSHHEGMRLFYSV